MTAPSRSGIDAAEAWIETLDEPRRSLVDDAVVTDLARRSWAQLRDG